MILRTVPLTILLFFTTSLCYAGTPHEYFLKGIDDIRQGNNTQAIADFTKSIETDPAFFVAYIDRGSIYLQTENFDLALADFDKAIELKPNDAKGYGRRGYVYYKLGHFEQAISDYSKAIELNPKNIPAYDGRGESYYKQEKYLQALDDYNKALKLGRPMGYVDAYTLIDRAITYEELGEIKLSQADFKRAIAEFTKHINATPGLASWEFYCRGFVYFREKEYDNAWKDYYQSQLLGYKPKVGDFLYLKELEKASGRTQWGTK